MSNGDKMTYEKLAKLIDTLRGNKVQAKEGTENVRPQDMAWYLDKQKQLDPSGKGWTTFPEFTPDMAKILISEIADSIIASNNAYSTTDIEALKERILNNFMSDFEIDENTGKVNRRITQDFLETIATPNAFNRTLATYEDDVWNDPRYVLKGDFLRLSLATAMSEEHNLMNENQAAIIANRQIIGPDPFEDVSGVYGEEYAMNWLSSWDERYPHLRTYLRTGRIFDDQGQLSVPVAGYNAADAPASISALVKFDINNPGRYETGKALVPQYGNTVTDRKRREIESKINEWGWNQDFDIAENIKNIMEASGIVNNKARVPDSNRRYSMGETQRDLIEKVEARMIKSIHTEGTKEYADEAVAHMMDLAGVNLEIYGAQELQMYQEIIASEWNPQEGLNESKDALNYLLNKRGYEASDLSDESYLTLAKTMPSYESFGDAFEDPTINMGIDNAIEAQGIITATEQRTKFNQLANIKQHIKRELRTSGLINEGTSREFESRIDSETIPEIARRIANMGGVNDAEELARIVAEMTAIENLGPGEDQLPAFNVLESDFRRQFMGSEKTPHAIPRDFTDPATGKTYQLPEFTVGAPKELEFEFDPYFITEEVQDLALERPEFANFLAQEMKKPGFMEAWQKASQPTFDAEKFETLRSGPVDPETGERVGGVAERAAAELAETKRELEPFERFGQYAPGSVSEDVTRLEEQRRQQEFFAGAGFQRQAKFQAMTPGQTTEEFFASQLPGFERRYKDSAFFKQEEARLKQEAEQQAAREDRERRTRTDRRQRERQALLRSGTGQGRGLSVFRRRE